ncbi:MAG: DHA2 family efflux MFS transporter permease subunit [Burkholderiales bacterium]|nr:DHA2 family efflux MFS transporter permease subunit [Burkholderiales bacterium]
MNNSSQTSDRLIWFTIIGGILAAFMSILDIQITNVAIGTIQHALNASIDQGSWISSAYLIAEIIGIPMTNLLLSRFGIRYTVLFSYVIFGISSILCAHAWNLPSMVIFRSIQGFTAGIVMSLAYVLIITKIKNPRDGQLAIILFGTIVSVAPITGPILGGVLTHYFDWKFIFYANIPFDILAIILVMFGLQKDIYTKSPDKIDWVGVITITIGLGCMQFFLEEGYLYKWFESKFILCIFIISIITLIIFVFNALLVKNPLINLKLLLNLKFAIACIGSFIAGAIMFAYIFVIPYLLVSVYNYTPIQISYIIMWIGFAQFIMIMFARILLSKLNIYLMIAIGLLFFAASVFIWGILAIKLSLTLIILAGLLRGISSTLFLTPLGVMATSSVPKDDASSASSLYNIARSLGGAIGIAYMKTFIVTCAAKYLLVNNNQIESLKLAFIDAFDLMSIILLITSGMFVILLILDKKWIKA